MTHATPEEIHDHAYGFRVSEHIPACDECRRSADAVAAERETLKDVLREDPMEIPADFLVRIEPSRALRPRFGAAALAAAALLLGALAWMLFQPKATVEPPQPPSSTSTHEEDIEKIIEHLKSASPLKQELARMALKKYGAIAIPVLERAKADRVLIEECRGYSRKDQDVYRKAQSTRLTVAWENTPLLTVIDQLRETSGLNFHISGVDNPDAIRVTLKAKDASVVEILDSLTALTKLPWSRTMEYAQPNSLPDRPPAYDPVYLFGPEALAPVSRVPVRVRSIRDWAEKQLKLPPDGRSAEDDARLIQQLISAGDPSLWNYLDSPRPELRRLAETGLRKLYGPPTAESRVPMEVSFAKSIASLSYENQFASEVFLDLGFREGVSLVLDPRIDIPDAAITFKTKDLSLKNNLTLLLGQFSMTSAMVGDTLIVTKSEWKPFRTSTAKILWTSPEEAQKAEAVIDGLAAGDKNKAIADAGEAGRPGLSWLSHGFFGIDAQRSTLFREALERAAAKMGVPLAESTGGADRQHLTPAQKAILEKELSIKSRERTLGELLKVDGIRIRFQAPMDKLLLVAAPRIRVDTLLVAVTRPLGLDFYMDGDTIVVDKEANVQTAVGKK